MKVSIIIPTYNEEEVILDCLESLGKQTHKDFEIIVVDDGSKDKTVKYVTNLQKVVPDIKLLFQRHEGPGAARNNGASVVKGNILVFVDADMTFDKDFLKKLTEPIRKDKVKGTFSKEEYVSNWNNTWARCWNINEGWEKKRRHPKNYPDEQPVFRSILKEEFDRVGGFTPGGYTDDWSLGKKLGYMAENAPSAKFYHKNPSSLSEIFKHAKWVGKRRYKLGMIGYIIALIRASLPVSILVGFVKSIFYLQPAFLLFKIVYDFGIFVGVVEYMILGQGAK
ncbi:glycosyltransferase [Patescibacteria group bacterium]|nr:glycosyltransferase [Patescibacteria group bacterium]